MIENETPPSGHVENDSCCKYLHRLQTLKQFKTSIQNSHTGLARVYAVVLVVGGCSALPSHQVCDYTSIRPLPFHQMLKKVCSCCFLACYSRQISQRSQWRVRGGGGRRFNFCLSEAGTQQICVCAVLQDINTSLD